jgi:TolB-like protein
LYPDLVRAKGAMVVLILGCGCAGQRASMQEATPEKPPITVAVIGLGGTNVAASDAEDGCVMAVLEAGFRAVDRQQIVAALPNENDVDFTAIGRALGCDLIVDGGVARGSRPALVRLEPRLISSHSANVLGMSKSKGRVKLSREIGRRLCAELLAQLP